MYRCGVFVVLGVFALVLAIASTSVSSVSNVSNVSSVYRPASQGSILLSVPEVPEVNVDLPSTATGDEEQDVGDKWKCSWGRRPSTGVCHTVQQQRDAFPHFDALLRGVSVPSEPQDVLCRKGGVGCTAVFRMANGQGLVREVLGAMPQNYSLFFLGDSTMRVLFRYVLNSFPKDARIASLDRKVQHRYGYSDGVVMRTSSGRVVRLALLWTNSPLLAKMSLAHKPWDAHAALFAVGLWALWKPTYEVDLLSACTFPSDVTHAITTINQAVPLVVVGSPDWVCEGRLKRNFIKEHPDVVPTVCQSENPCAVAVKPPFHNSRKVLVEAWRLLHGKLPSDLTPASRKMCLGCRGMCERALLTGKGSQFLGRLVEKAVADYDDSGVRYANTNAFMQSVGCEYCEDGLHHKKLALDLKVSYFFHHLLISQHIPRAAGKALYAW